jgi:dUTP pyrophosphatase
MNNICVCCGAVIPEGSHVCKNCQVASAPEWMVKHLKEVKTEVKKESKKVKKVRVKKKPTIKVVLDDGAKMPHRAHSADAGYDLFSREDAVIHPNTGGVFDTGVHVAIPEGYVGFLKSKSGLNVKHSIQSEGVIDCGYTGSIHVKLFNHGTRSVTIEKGQKISQLVLLPIITPDLELVDSLDQTERGNGGFGSTGKF